jgi:dihydroxy-acid dehydratase
MESANLNKQHQAEEARYLSFKHLPDGTMRDGKPALNKFSSTLTNEHDFPGAQVNDMRPL